MAEKPIKTPLPADLPENWDAGQIVAPDGTSVGLTEQHGYNYLMAAVNRAQRGVNEVNEAFETISTGAAKFVVGTSTNGWTAADCDYLCNGKDDQVEIQEAINELPHGGEVILLPGTYSLNEAVFVWGNVWLHGISRGSVTLKRVTADGSGTVKSIIFVEQNGKISDFTLESYNEMARETYDVFLSNSCSVDNIYFQNHGGMANSIYISSRNSTTISISRCTWFVTLTAIYAKLGNGNLYITQNYISSGTFIQTEPVGTSYPGLRVFICGNGDTASMCKVILDGLCRSGGNIIQGNMFGSINILNTINAKFGLAGSIISGNVLTSDTGSPRSTVISLGENTTGWFVTGNSLLNRREEGDFVIRDLGTENVVRFNSDDPGGSTPATVQQATPSITVNGDGTVTARATQAAGYVAAGTRSATHKLSSADDTDLTPENIKNGVSIFGVQGTLDAGGGTAGVTSFNGRSGAVMPGNNDYTAKMVGAVTASAVEDILAVTQSEYDSLPVKDPETLYLIKE